jgi:asparagine synthase (glutamine-hydrolysing)
MCGISGYFGNQNNKPSEKEILNTLKIMKNRGRDGQGSYSLNTNENFFLNLNHTRLSIIDPNKLSNQPFVDKDGVIIFNGMIYNYLELKKKLQNKCNFQTNSDTEVLLKFLNTFGIEKIDEVDGMWAFAYYNFKKKKLFLSRDRFGEKPLFYNVKNKNLIFGSCLNYILSLKKQKFKINYNKLENYLKFGFRTLNIKNESLLKNVFSIEPGSFIELDKFLKIKKKFYWKPKKYIINNKLNFNIEKKKLKKTFSNVINTRLRSDFPLSCLLSGGIDSSSIVSVANKKIKRKIDCFSLLSKDLNYNENYYIQKTIKREKLKHRYIGTIKNNRKNLNHLEKLISSTASLVPTTTWLAYSFLCKNIKKLKYKVVLSGTGGDEIFAGYYIHHLHYLFSIKDKKVFKEKFKEWEVNLVPLLRNNFLKDFFSYKKKVIENKDLMFYDFLTLKNYFKRFDLINSVRTSSKIDYFKKSLMNDLFKYSLQSQISAIDNISMFHGLEARAPYLSKDLFKKSFSFPSNFLINKGYGKYILRKSLQGSLDPEILNNRDKVGFYTDIDNLFNLRDKKFVKFLNSNSFVNSLINKEKLNLLLLKKNKTNQECHFIFSIINVIFFIKKYG